MSNDFCVIGAGIIGLAVAHLLRGMALIVQHPKRYKVYWVHLVWVMFLFLYVIHYWWWEFNLELVRQWCRRAIYLRQGVAQAIGPVDEVIARYEAAVA